MKQVLTDEQIEKIKELADQGLRQRDIAKQLGLSQSMVRYWYTKVDYAKKEERGLKMCGTCKYRSQICCEYLLVTGRQRNCSPYNCDKYVKGKFKGNQTISGYGFALSSRSRKTFDRMAYSQEDKGV